MEVREDGRTGGLPADHLTGEPAGGGLVTAEERTEDAEHLGVDGFRRQAFKRATIT